jgi:predicted transcriptional regulator
VGLLAGVDRHPDIARWTQHTHASVSAGSTRDELVTDQALRYNRDAPITGFGDFSMAYAFPPDLRQLIHEQLATGQYVSEDDVLRDALTALKWRSAEIAAIAEGIEDMEAGRYRSVDEVDADLRRKHNFPQDA